MIVNSTNPDQTAPHEQSDLGLNCLSMAYCLNSYVKYGNASNS